MDRPRSTRLPGLATTLLIGLGIGWFAASSRTPTLHAMISGADRFNESVVLAAPIAQDYDERTKIQVPQDALFFLDYRAGRLLATIPALKQSASGTQVIEGFAERDLAADFRIDGSLTPHFVMTAGSLGAKGTTWSPLFVFETVSRQVAVYRVQAQSSSKKSPAKFDLLEVRPYLGEPTLPDLPTEPVAPPTRPIP